MFLQFLSIITLYLSAVSFGELLFQYINIYFPDPLTDVGASFSVYRSPLRFAIATLVVVFPVFLWVSRYFAREIRQFPEKGELRTRKWLLNFTLFAAALIIIGDLVALVNRYLEGDITLRFILKVCVILAIAAVIFRYYLWSLRTHRVGEDKQISLLIYGIIAAVAISTFAGFFVAGSPQSERLRRFDEQRVFALQNIQGQIVSFWQTKGQLPASLADLRDPISGYQTPNDPETGISYEYRVLGDLHFELCATFKTDSAVSSFAPEYAMPRAAPPVVPYADMQDNWAHGSGRACFDRTIDPKRYRLGPGTAKSP